MLENITLPQVQGVQGVDMEYISHQQYTAH